MPSVNTEAKIEELSKRIKELESVVQEQKSFIQAWIQETASRNELNWANHVKLHMKIWNRIDKLETDFYFSLQSDSGLEDSEST